ncbi:MAG: TIM44-like domain-containing protein [Planctomycetes bacterium]|nr:TIM44-like domain-containing protein [Planctomycetota bacterium]
MAISAPVELEARAGGGHSSGGRSGGSSGGSRSSSSSSSRSSSSSSSSRGYGGSRSSGSSGRYSGSTSPGGYVALVMFFGILGVVVVFFVMLQRAANANSRKWALPPQPRPDPLKQVQAVDPNFSLILFKAFAYLIYVKYHEWSGSRGAGKAVLPYLMPQVKAQGASGPAVSGVLIEALTIESVFVTAEHVIIDVKFQATLMLADKGPRSRILRDDGVRFLRSVKARTPAPESVLRLGCPQCGSPEEPKPDGACPSCGAVNARGDISWCIADIQGEVLNFKPEQLGQGGGVEVGTDRQTHFDPGLNAGLRQLSMRDPAFNTTEFLNRAKFIFHEIQAGWSELNEARLRPHEVDTVFDSHRYWLMHYRDQGIRNVLGNVNIENMQIAKVAHDAWFDAITVRIFASMIDYEIDRSGRVLCGNQRQPRRFSEYWTLVRRSDLALKAAQSVPACPSCGAPLDKVNQSGVCGYCNSHVTLGEFDWVLALIEQDETYEG